MKRRNGNDLDVLAEAAGILAREMTPSQVARLYWVLRLGKGDYLALKDRLFRGETVESLVRKMRSDRPGAGRAGRRSTAPVVRKAERRSKTASGKRN